MNLRIPDDRYLRELRRVRLATRMLSHEARTRTIRLWTGISRDRVRKLAIAMGSSSTPSDAPVRHRGSSPWQIAYFFRSHRVMAHAATLGSLLALQGVLPKASERISPKEFASVARGEVLCDAYETYLQFTSQPVIDFEHTVLLATALVAHNEIELAPCLGCGALLVVDQFAPRSLDQCTYCRPGPGPEAATADVAAMDQPIDGPEIPQQSHLLVYLTEDPHSETAEAAVNPLRRTRDKVMQQIEPALRCAEPDPTQDIARMDPANRTES
jgi:hypothetical protein